MLRQQGEVGEYQGGSIVPRYNIPTLIQDDGRIWIKARQYLSNCAHQLIARTR